jgi:hypothetical protein
VAVSARWRTEVGQRLAAKPSLYGDEGRVDADGEPDLLSDAESTGLVNGHRRQFCRLRPGKVCGGSRFDTNFPRGLQLFNVSDPAHPVEIGFFSTGCCTRGLHEFEVEHNPDLGRTFAFATVPGSEEPDSSSPTGIQDQDGKGPFRLIDITNPVMPFEASNWGFLHDGVAPGAGQGCDPDALFGHGSEPSRRSGVPVQGQRASP